VQALYDQSEGAGAFYADVRVDALACAALLQKVTPGQTGPVHEHIAEPERILLPPASTYGTLGAWHVEVAIATISLDADGQPLPDTFYPYYGSSARPQLVPHASRTFQSQFRPYAVIPLDIPGSKQTSNAQGAATCILWECTRAHDHIGWQLTWSVSMAQMFFAFG
jgi:hypothetical protein